MNSGLWSWMSHSRDFSREGVDGRVLCRDVLSRFDHLVVIRSLGKSHGIAGLRLGVLATSNADLLNEVRAQLPVWNINAPAEHFLQLLDGSRQDYERSCRAVAEERDWVSGSLADLGLGMVLDSGANFVTFVLDGQVRSYTVAARMLRKGFLVKDLSAKRGIECQALRLAVRDRHDNERVVEAMEASIRECLE